jgi:hypothetical protein
VAACLFVSIFLITKEYATAACNTDCRHHTTFYVSDTVTYCINYATADCRYCATGGGCDDSIPKSVNPTCKIDATLDQKSRNLGISCDPVCQPKAGSGGHATHPNPTGTFGPDGFVQRCQ